MQGRLSLYLLLLWLLSVLACWPAGVDAAKILTAPSKKLDQTLHGGDNQMHEIEGTGLHPDIDDDKLEAVEKDSGTEETYDGSYPEPYNNMPVPLTPLGDATNNFLESYGVWCGGNHGGFQDCCGGKPCPNCKIKHGVVPETLLTPECLAECPPTDILDHACAWHDACTFSHDRPLNFTCSPQGNECFCDCTLVRTAYNLTCPSYSCTAYRAALDELFLHGTACYVRSDNGTLTCEGLRSGVGLYTHCLKGEPVFGNTSFNGITKNEYDSDGRRILGDEAEEQRSRGDEPRDRG